jgi:spore coat polysaccharide biosynthesis protein SpsF
MKNILIRCDASQEIGLGHIVRCSELAKQLEKQEFNILFAIKPYEIAIQALEDKGLNYTCATLENFNFETWIKNLIDTHAIDTFIGDIRDNFPIELIHYMKSKNILTIAIDEPSPYAKECDFAFYPPHANIDKKLYKGKVYRGLEYLILREEFYKPFAKVQNSIPNLLVMMGGTDSENITLDILNQIDKPDTNFVINVIVKENHPKYQEISNLSNNSKHTINLYSSIKNMAEFLNHIDFAIVRFGTIVYELIAKNIPALHIYTDEKSATHFFEENHFAINSSLESVSKDIEKLFKIKFTTTMKPQNIISTITSPLTLDLKESYAHNHAKPNDKSIYLNQRLFTTYNTITNKLLQQNLTGINLDLGSGDKGFSAVCKLNNIQSTPYDYPEFNLEKDLLPHQDNSIDFITMNAVIEHIANPSHILGEIKRVLKKGGLLFIRTPNWQLDFKNFYNDPTHIKPYSPQTLKNTIHLAGLQTLFVEPGLICKNWFWWTLPENMKWRIASLIKGGTKSILLIARKD